MATADSSVGSSIGSNIGPKPTSGPVAGDPSAKQRPAQSNAAHPPAQAAAKSGGQPAAGGATSVPAPEPDGQPGSMRRYAAWLFVVPVLFSLIMHVASLLGLALVVVPGEGGTAAVAITSSMSSDAPVEEFTPVQIDPPEKVVEFEQPTVDVPAVDAAPISVGDVGSNDAVPDVGDLAGAEAVGTGIADLAGMDFRPGRGRGGDGDGSAMGAVFFGKKVKGGRFVFVVDNSASMNSGKMETALYELSKSVEGMAPNQQFYVLFFSDTDYGLFHPQTAPGLMPATPENKQRLASWLATVEMCYGTRGVSALEKALLLNPDVINILGDGAFTDKVRDMLTAPHSRKTVINTFGMGMNAAGEQEMTAIAEANGGNFTKVEVLPAAREAAQRNPIKANKSRGPVWGLKLGNAKPK